MKRPASPRAVSRMDSPSPRHGSSCSPACRRQPRCFEQYRLHLADELPPTFALLLPTPSAARASMPCPDPRIGSPLNKPCFPVTSRPAHSSALSDAPMEERLLAARRGHFRRRGCRPKLRSAPRPSVYDFVRYNGAPATLPEQLSCSPVSFTARPRQNNRHWHPSPKCCDRAQAARFG